MILSKILVGIDGLKAMGNLEVEINNISQDSSNIFNNSFSCIFLSNIFSQVSM